MDKEISMKALREKMKHFLIQSTEKLAIYGTGVGAEFVCDLLKEMNLFDQVEKIIEREGEIDGGDKKYGIQLCCLKECCRDIDVVFVGALVNHAVVRERLERFLESNKDCNFRIIDLYGYNSEKDEISYLHFLEKVILKEKSMEFVEYDDSQYEYKYGDTRIIAWYLPQFHEIEVNNKYLGRGFTEWTNTTRAFPIYEGHYQPHIPYDVGYYNLNNLKTIERQIELARHYGVYGFSFYYYWFSGTKLMEEPLNNLLKHPELNIKFCITWADENWTTLWDAGQHGIIYRQKIEKGDGIRFVDDLLKVIQDKRYITIDGKPLIIIYRGNIFKKETMLALVFEMKKRARQHGFKDLYIMVSTAGNFDEDVAGIGADALVEFPPHGMNSLDIFYPNGYVNPYFVGKILDTSKFIKGKKYLKNHDGVKFYRAALTSWDNTARKARSGANIYHGLCPKTFKQWLEDIIIESKKIHSEDENMVFVNSWNEWAEGSHLEPDMKYGYAYLQTVKDVLETSRKMFGC